VCRYFLQAIEEKKYGWFWQCPNGEACLYRYVACALDEPTNASPN